MQREQNNNGEGWLMLTDVRLEPIKQVLKHLRGLSEATLPGWREAPPPRGATGAPHCS